MLEALEAGYPERAYTIGIPGASGGYAGSAGNTGRRVPGALLARAQGGCCAQTPAGAGAGCPPGAAGRGAGHARPEQSCGKPKREANPQVCGGLAYHPGRIFDPLSQAGAGNFAARPKRNALPQICGAPAAANRYAVSGALVLQQAPSGTVQWYTPPAKVSPYRCWPLEAWPLEHLRTNDNPRPVMPAAAPEKCPGTGAPAGVRHRSRRRGQLLWQAR